MKAIVRHFVLSVFILPLALLSQSKHFYAELRGAMHTHARRDFRIGMDAMAGYQATPYLGVGAGIGRTMYFYPGVNFSGQVRGYIPVRTYPFWYYSLRAGGGLLNMNNAPLVHNKGQQVFAEAMMGIRVKPSMVLGMGYTRWKQFTQFYVPDYTSEFAGESYTITLLYTFDGASRKMAHPEIFYAYFSQSLLAVSVNSLMGGLRYDVVSQVGAGVKLTDRWGVGADFTGLGNSPWDIINVRQLHGLGLHLMHRQGRLLGWGGLGYAIKANDGLSDYYNYQFYPTRSPGFAPYGRLSVGVLIWRGLMLQANWLQTFSVEGDYLYTAQDEDGLITDFNDRIRHSMGSFSIGLGYLIQARESRF